jgi:hypothetical protein
VLDRFWPSNLFLGGIPGAWYDPTDLSTMFQDSAGTTPVTAVEQPVGRILDKSGNGNHASQSTAASRPTYRARYNLLTYSEQLQNAAWTTFGTVSISADATTAPDGTTTADKFVAIGAGSIEHLIEQSTPPQAGVYTVSVYAKPSEYSWIILKPVHVGDSGGTSQVSFNMATKTWDASGANRITSYSYQELPNGWFRVVATFSITSACTSLRARYSVSATASPVYVADLTSGAFLWGAQLLTAADVTATGNAYQRIAAATVYDTAAVFRPYLAFDGLDDSLSTSAINFTSTDKMTVFAGVTKSSDAASGTVVELSADVATNNGTFYMRAPNSATPDFLFLSKGTTFRFVQATPFASPSTAVLTGVGDIAAPVVVFRRNGAQVGTNALSQGTGTYGTYPLFIGRQNNAIYPLNGRLFSLIVRGAASSVTEIAGTELWVNARTGAY